MLPSQLIQALTVYSHMKARHIITLFAAALSGGIVLAQGPRPDDLGASPQPVGEAGVAWYTTWATALDDSEVSNVWPLVKRRLGLGDPYEIRRFISGDGDRIPLWTGYALGNRIVQSYLKQHPRSRAASLVGMQAELIFEGSGFGQKV